MKALFKITSALAAAFLALAVVSCTEKETVLPSLDMPGNATYTSDFGSITISWSAVPNAGQYQYIVKNPLKYVVAKGFTTATSVTVKSLSPATTYTVQIKAIPQGADYQTYSGSDYYVVEATTAAPKSYDYKWSHPATIWWNYDNPVHKSDKATFGLTNDGKYVLQAWGGVIGMDLVFTLSDHGEWLIDYAESTAYLSGPDGNMAVGLAHGIGGTQAGNCWFYTNNTGSSFEGNEAGGHGEAWMYNPDGDWTGYYFTYGEYVEPTPEPEPIDPDPTEAMDRKAEITFDDTAIGNAHVTFDPETGVYVVDSWFGVEGYGIAFTRDAETGEWIIDPEKSTAYVSGPDADGYYDMAHGIAPGKGVYTTCLVPGTISGSGKDGDSFYATILGPEHKSGTYYLSLIPDMASFISAGSAYIAGEKVGDGWISYDAETRLFTIHSWFGVEGHDVAFTLVNGEWVLDKEHTTAWLYDEDGNHAIGLSNGLTSNTCWFYTTDTRSWLDGNEKEGSTGCSMYDPYGNWSEYSFVWKEGDWTVEGNASFYVDNTKETYPLGTATLSYSAETGVYTLHGWYGVEGHDVVFTPRETGDWNIDYEASSAYISGPDGNNAVGLSNGIDGAATCWFYITDYYSSFTGNQSSGRMGAWMWNAKSEWGEYIFEW